MKLFAFDYCSHIVRKSDGEIYQIDSGSFGKFLWWLGAKFLA